MHDVFVLCDVVAVIHGFEGKDQIIDAGADVSDGVHFPGDLRDGTVVGGGWRHELVDVRAFNRHILWQEVPRWSLDVCELDDLFRLRHVVARIDSRVGPNDG